MADQEQEPAHPGDQHGQRLAGGVVFLCLCILPQEPVGGEGDQPEGGDMLLQVEEALRLPVASLLDRDAHIDAVFGVDPGAHDEGEHPQHADRRGIARAVDAAEAGDEAGRSGRLPHRHQH